MLTPDDNKRPGKPGQRKRNAQQQSKKSEARRKNAQPQELQPAAPQEPQPRPELPQDQFQIAPAPEAVTEPVAPTRGAINEPSAAILETIDVPSAPAVEIVSEPSASVSEAVSELAASEPEADREPSDPVSTALTVLPDAYPIVPVASPEAVPVSYRSIANAYCNSTLQSIDRTRSFFEQLAGARSLNKAVELEVEFARQSYEDFVTESQKICELHGQLASQRLKRWEDFVSRIFTPSH